MADWQRRVEIKKLDEAKNLVFGYLSVSENADGSLVEDLQGDVIEPTELEKAAYAFMLESRAADEMHRLDQIGQVVESAVFTKEKQQALGIPDGTMPVGWWVGIKVDPEVFAKVKDGDYRAFSIGGRGERHG